MKDSLSPLLLEMIMTGLKAALSKGNTVPSSPYKPADVDIFIEYSSPTTIIK